MSEDYMKDEGEKLEGSMWDFKRRLEQTKTNQDWLLRQFFLLEEYLGLDTVGTWQNRVKEVVAITKQTHDNLIDMRKEFTRMAKRGASL